MHRDYNFGENTIWAAVFTRLSEDSLVPDNFSLNFGKSAKPGLYKNDSRIRS